MSSIVNNEKDIRKKNRLVLIFNILEEMLQNPTEWDKCEFNIHHLKSSFLNRITGDKVFEQFEINDIYYMLYRFLCEFELIGGDLSAGNDFDRFHSFIHDDVHLDPADEKLIRKINYAAYEMPARITTRILRSEIFDKFYHLEKTITQAEKLRIDLNSDLERHTKEAKDLNDKLTIHKKGMNFALLHQGFSSIYRRKEREEWLLRGSLITMGIVLLIPLLIGLLITTKAAGSSFEWSHLAYIIPIVSIELVLIYFFRILLVNHKSVRTQMLQIELRASLCEFIEHYADFAKRAKEKDNSSLDKFESLIFSNILSDSDHMPSTFDGIDQIGKIIQNFKSK